MSQERQNLLSRLLDAVKQCQIRFGGRKELATESDPRISCLCVQFEAVLNHGLKPRNSKGRSAVKQMTDMMSSSLNLSTPPEALAMWHYVREHLNRHECERYLLLKNINTDVGRGRAWLRSSLNEHSLERYMHMLLSDYTDIHQYYEEWAFLIDQERSSMLPVMAAGLGSILFAISIDNPDLNHCRLEQRISLSESVFTTSPQEVALEPVIASSSLDGKKKERKKKKKIAQIISFDDDVSQSPSSSVQSPTYCSAPPTCLSSPTDFTSPYGGVFKHTKDMKLMVESRKDAADTAALVNQAHTAVLDRLSEDPTSLCQNSDKSLSSNHCENVSQNQSMNGLQSNFDNMMERDSEMKTSFASKECKYRDDLRPSTLTLSGNNGQGCSQCSESEESEPIIHYEPVKLISSNKMSLYSEEETQRTGTCGTKLASKFGTHYSAPLKASHSLNSDGSEGRNSEAVIQTSPTQTLTPVNNVSVGELIPVSEITDEIEPQSEEDSLSVPSYSEDTDYAAAALALTQKVMLTNITDMSSKERTAANVNSRGERTDILTLPSGDLKQALLAVVSKKEELEEKNHLLQSLLDQEMETSSCLRVEMEDSRHQQDDRGDKLEARIQALSRENELMKHQLKKYVGAVQMLKRDGTQAHETLATLEASHSNRQTESSTFIDYHFEATEYERKLIQVAEMHGELMEFNERLHRILQQKEYTIHRLKEELIDLRGPLPDEVQTSDDDLSITSDYDASSLFAATRALINIWIPSAFLTGGTSDIHHVYQVYIRIRDDEWNIYRRYAQFYILHKQLKKKEPVVNTFDFPPKKTLGNKDAKFVEERRKKLQQYLRCVCNLMVQKSPDLANAPDKETLISLMPFFGEYPGVEEKKKTRRQGSRNPFSRFSSRNESAEPTTPQYTGL